LMRQGKVKIFHKKNKKEKVFFGMKKLKKK
jgi:hypothetical protein